MAVNSENTSAPATNDERAQRLLRRQALLDAGVNPYPVHSTVTAHAAELEERYAELADGECTEDVYSLAGRIRAFRTEGHVQLFSWNMLGKVAVVAVPSILQQSFVSVGNIILQSVINTFGASVIAGYSAAVKLNNMVITSFTTLGNGISNYTSQNMGAGKMDRVHEGFGAGRNLVWIICVPIVLLYFFFGRFLLLLFMNDPQGPAIDTGMLFLHILSPFYFVVSLKLVTDGILRGCGLMGRFMVATFTDLILRVGIAAVLSATALGSTGIWMAWPVGWCIGTALSMVFYATAIRKALAQPVAAAEAEGQAAEVRAEAEFAADAEMETL